MSVVVTPAYCTDVILVMDFGDTTSSAFTLQPIADEAAAQIKKSQRRPNPLNVSQIVRTDCPNIAIRSVQIETLRCARHEQSRRLNPRSLPAG